MWQAAWAKALQPGEARNHLVLIAVPEQDPSEEQDPHH